MGQSLNKDFKYYRKISAKREDIKKWQTFMGDREVYTIVVEWHAALKGSLWLSSHGSL